ncbi:MAG: lipopolysaccharide biosynthesis protein [Chitinophagaceae bacterium]
MVRNFIWDLSGKVSGYIISLGTSMILSRILLPEDFGIISIAQIFSLIISVVMEMGLSSALIQQKDLSEEEINVSFTMNLAVVLLLSAVLFIAAPFISDFYGNAKLLVAVRIICIQLVFAGLSVVPMALLYRELKFKEVTGVTSMSALLGALIAVVMAFQGFGFYSLVAQNVIASVVQFATLVLMFKYRPKMNFAFRNSYKLFSFSFKIFLSTLLNQVFQKVDVLIFGRTYQMASLGYYNRATSIDNILRNVSSSSILNILLPQISRMQGNKPEVEHLYNKVLHLLCFVFFLVAGGMFLLSDDLILLLYGKKWSESGKLLKYVLISSFTYPVSSLILSVIEGLGFAGLFLRLELIKKAVMVPFLALPFVLSMENYLLAVFVLGYIQVYINLAGLSRVANVSIWSSVKVILTYSIISVAAVCAGYFVVQLFGAGIFLRILTGGGVMFIVYMLGNFAFQTIGMHAVRKQLAYRLKF